MKIEDLRDYALGKAESFGFVQKKDEASPGNAVFRYNPNDKKGANYFGFINPDEPFTNAYSDFSLVVFAIDGNSTFL